MNVIYCLIITDWNWLMSFMYTPCIPMQINPIKVHWGTGSWPLSFESSATNPPQTDHVLVDLFSAIMPQALQAHNRINERTCIKDPWTKPKGVRLRVGRGGGQGVGKYRWESGGNYTWTIKRKRKRKLQFDTSLLPKKYQKLKKKKNKNAN